MQYMLQSANNRVPYDILVFLLVTYCTVHSLVWTLKHGGQYLNYKFVCLALANIRVKRPHQMQSEVDCFAGVKLILCSFLCLRASRSTPLYLGVWQRRAQTSSSEAQSLRRALSRAARHKLWESKKRSTVWACRPRKSAQKSCGGMLNGPEWTKF